MTSVKMDGTTYDKFECGCLANHATGALVYVCSGAECKWTKTPKFLRYVAEIEEGD